MLRLIPRPNNLSRLQLAWCRGHPHVVKTCSIHVHTISFANEKIECAGHMGAFRWSLADIHRQFTSSWWLQMIWSHLKSVSPSANTMVTRRWIYRKTSNISRTLVGNKIVDNPDVVGASPVGAAPTTSSFSIQHLASMDWAKTTARGYKKHLSLGIWCDLY